MQNIYDDPVFFAGYQNLRKTESGLNEAIEQPALRALLPPLDGLRILDLGCGFGEFARAARQRNARSVVALDPSRRMLNAARAMTPDDGIEYIEAGIENLPLVQRQFDLVVSSLAFHYVADFDLAASNIAQNLRYGGRFIFSVEHPMCTALAAQRWETNDNGTPRHWPVDMYGSEGPRSTTWFIKGVVKYHRTVSSYVNALTAAGFRIERLEEPEPTSEALAKRPDLDVHKRRPPFLVISADYLP